MCFGARGYPRVVTQQQIRHDDPRIEVTRAALAPYGWQGLSSEMVARRVVAALDRHWVDQELARTCGVSSAVEEVEPASRDDERVAVLMQVLRQCRWRSLTVTALSRQALAALDAWERERAWRGIERAWLSG